MDDTLVLCYHAISETWAADLSVTPEALERQLSSLVDRGYRAVSFGDAVRGVSGRALAVTFDDAPRSVYELALPILSRLGLVGTVFVPTSYVDSDEPMSWPGVDHWIDGPHEAELLCMGRAQLEELVEHGWEIGSHTHTHPHLTRVDSSQVMTELRRSRELLEEWLGRPCCSLAYPYGDVSSAVVDAVREAGYTTAATLDAAMTPGDPLLWPRVGVYHGDAIWRFRLKSSPSVRRIGIAQLRHPLEAHRGRSLLTD